LNARVVFAVSVMVACLTALRFSLTEDQPAGGKLAVFLEGMEKKASSVKDLTARFTQEKKLKICTAPLVSEGVLFMKSGEEGRRKIVWRTQKPEEILHIIDGGKLTVYFPALREAEEYDLSKARPEFTRLLLAPQITKGMTEDFDVEILQEPAGDQKDTVLGMKPKAALAKKYMAEVRLWVEPRDSNVWKFQYIEPNGDSTTISLQDIKLNTDLTDEVFGLKLPADVKVTRPLEQIGR
jgi:outer membrane lipoprotein-sorting protein